MLDLKQYGYIETEPIPDGLLPARVTAVHKERYELVCRQGTRFGKLKTSIYYGREPQIYPTIGDFVFFKEVEGGDCQIVETLPRKSYFARLDPDPVGGKQQAVAANFDFVFIMTSLNQDYKINRIERYLILTRQSGATPVVILTKADLVENADAAISQIQAVTEDVDIIPVSIISGTGLCRLNDYLISGKTAVFLGMSGVGKSSLLNTLMGQEVMTVKAIREDDSRGRHTTTHRELFMLPSGSMIIDTPGMRRVGMWDAKDGLSETFADVEALLGNCRFSDCRHGVEPGCAIHAAIESGDLPIARWDNYCKLQREASYTDSKAAIMSKKREKNKAIAMWSKQMKKNGGFKNGRYHYSS